jgi:hypothetical protein
MQRHYLSKFLNPIIQDAGIYLGYNWSNIALDIAKPMPVSFAGDIPVSQVLTTDEMRAELGWQPTEEQSKEENNSIDDNIN